MDFLPPGRREINSIAPILDHTPIVLQTVIPMQRPYRRTFRFENMWLQEPKLDGVIERSWDAGDGSELTHRLSNCARDLAMWAKKISGRFRVEIDECNRKLKALQGLSDDDCVAAFKATQERLCVLLCVLLSQEELYWRQRAKSFWLRDGDCNTKYFHASASTKRRRNKIQKLRGEGNVLITDQIGMCDIARSYFQNLFAATDGVYDPVVSIIEPRITQEDNRTLEAPFTIEEFKVALFQMHPDKALGPNGFNPAVYQHIWNLCGLDIFHTACKWLEQGTFPTSLTDTNVVLIPKCDNPEDMRDFHPISLCNVVYKIVTKVLANRLKKVLPCCISEVQSAFIEGRAILDNAMIATEIVHYMRCKTRGKLGDVTLKINISKAYDRVDWRYLELVMLRLGFSFIWVKWMVMCVKSVHYSILVNHDHVGPIDPSRGLCQGDPLSPYLFLLCAEGLSAMIRDEQRKGTIYYPLVIC